MTKATYKDLLIIEPNSKCIVSREYLISTNNLLVKSFLWNDLKKYIKQTNRYDICRIAYASQIKVLNFIRKEIYGDNDLGIIFNKIIDIKIALKRTKSEIGIDRINILILEGRLKFVKDRIKRNDLDRYENIKTDINTELKKYKKKYHPPMHIIDDYKRGL